MIAVDGFGGATGKIALSLQQDVLIPPNDLFTNRITLIGLSNTVSCWNLDASLEDDEPRYSRFANDSFYYYESSVWWTWTAPTNGIVIVDTAGSSFTTGLGVFTGDVPQISRLLPALMASIPTA